MMTFNVGLSLDVLYCLGLCPLIDSFEIVYDLDLNSFETIIMSSLLSLYIYLILDNY